MLKDKALYWVIGFSILIFWSRMMPYAGNFTPVLALCILAGYVGRGSVWSIILPVAALFASDWTLGFFPGWTLNYLALSILVIAGRYMSVQFKSVVRFGILAPFLFFVISNFGVWMYSEMYPMTWDGLTKCYNLALPFARINFASTMVCLLAFYGVHFAWQKIAQKGSVERF